MEVDSILVFHCSIEIILCIFRWFCDTQWNKSYGSIWVWQLLGHYSFNWNSMTVLPMSSLPLSLNHLQNKISGSNALNMLHFYLHTVAEGHPEWLNSYVSVVKCAENLEFWWNTRRVSFCIHFVSIVIAVRHAAIWKLSMIFFQCQQEKPRAFTCATPGDEKSAKDACGVLLKEPFKLCHDEVRTDDFLKKVFVSYFLTFLLPVLCIPL